MIKRILLFIVILAVLIPAAGSFALVNHANSGTMYVYEDEFQVTFYGTMGPMTPDSTTNWYTKSMYVGDCNWGHAFIACKPGDGTSAGTNDVNVFVEHASFLGASEVWYPGIIVSGQVLDQLTGTTLQSDTLDNNGNGGQTETAIHDRLYNAMSYMRLYFDGQTGNDDHSYVIWYCTFTKKVPGSKNIGKGRITSCTN